MVLSRHNPLHNFLSRQYTEHWSELDVAQGDLGFISRNALPGILEESRKWHYQEFRQKCKANHTKNLIDNLKSNSQQSVMFGNHGSNSLASWKLSVAKKRNLFAQSTRYFCEKRELIRRMASSGTHALWEIPHRRYKTAIKTSRKLFMQRPTVGV